MFFLMLSTYAFNSRSINSFLDPKILQGKHQSSLWKKSQSLLSVIALIYFIFKYPVYLKTNLNCFIIWKFILKYKYEFLCLFFLPIIWGKSGGGVEENFIVKEQNIKTHSFHFHNWSYGKPSLGFSVTFVR